jgi:hypothetical protein
MLSKQKKKVAHFLVFLLKNKGEKCPYNKFYHLNEKLLWSMAKKNKLVFLFEHFLECKKCQSRLQDETISKYIKYKKIYLQSALYNKKLKKELGKFLKKSKIKAVLLKNFSSYNNLSFYQNYLIGSDLDILIEKNSLQKVEEFFKDKNFKKLKDLEIEVTFQNVQKYLNVDVHHLISFPTGKRKSYFFNKSKINNLTDFFLKNSALDQNSNFYILDKELFLFSLIVHFWANNLGRGLRNLYDILYFAECYKKQIDWKQISKYFANFNLSNLASLTFYLGEKLFGIPYPYKLQQLIKPNLRVKLVIRYFSFEEITIFPHVEKWFSDNKRYRKIQQDQFFINLILNENNSLFRLMRPKIIMFVLRNYIKNNIDYLKFQNQLS